MTTAELLECVKRAGGVLELNGDKFKCRLPENAAQFAELLRERKPEVMELLKARGGRVAAFPHCPQCTSYCLYREYDRGSYECMTCGASGIDEVAARRTQ